MCGWVELMKDHLTRRCHVDAFLIDCGQEWSSVAPREEIYQALMHPVTPFHDFFSPKGFVEEKDRYRFAAALSLSSIGDVRHLPLLSLLLHHFSFAATSVSPSLL